jgi:hypothetical protein
VHQFVNRLVLVAAHVVFLAAVMTRDGLKW